MLLNGNITTVRVKKGITVEEHKNILKEAEEKIFSQPDKSVLMLTILEERVGNKIIIENHKAFSKKVSPKIKKSAVIGVSLVTDIAIKAIKLLTKRDIKTFSTESEAIQWLKS